MGPLAQSRFLKRTVLSNVTRPGRRRHSKRVLGSADVVSASRIVGEGPPGALPLTPEMLRESPSGNLFGLTQNVGMGWSPAALGGPEFVIVSTAGGLRDSRRLADRARLSHRPLGDRTARATKPRETLRARRRDSVRGVLQRSVRRTHAGHDRHVRQPALSQRRGDRDAPSHSLAADGVAACMGIATCDKGLPATMLALAGCSSLPGVVVPGGVTLPAVGAEDAGQVQSLGARFAHDLISLDYAAEMGCRACGSSGGGCQFLGTAATSQVVAEALGLALPHSALAPSGEPSWFELGERSALALMRLHALGDPASSDILTVARDRERDARARRVRRIDEPAAAHSRDRARGGTARRRRSRIGFASTGRRRGWSTRCRTDRAVIRPCRCSWRAACPR